MPNLNLGVPPAPAPGTFTYPYFKYGVYPDAPPTKAVGPWSKMATSANWMSTTIPTGGDGIYYLLHAILPIELVSLTPQIRFFFDVDGVSLTPLLTYGQGRMDVTGYHVFSLFSPPFTLAAGAHTFDMWWEAAGTGSVALDSANAEAAMFLVSPGNQLP